MIRYAECQTRPVRTMPAGCGCDDSACEFSRIRDGFEIRAIPKAKPDGKKHAEGPTLCDIEKDITRNLPPFPAPPASDWVELATIEFKDAKKLTDKLIDNNTRHVLYSTAQIQAQVIGCCCKI